MVQVVYNQPKLGLGSIPGIVFLSLVSERNEFLNFRERRCNAHMDCGLLETSFTEQYVSEPGLISGAIEPPGLAFVEVLNNTIPLS